jgi:sugar/nucleoside kinase (ribokinase family)
LDGRPDAPHERSVDVLGVGLASVDLLCLVERYPEPESKSGMLDFARQGGGQVGTACAAVARLGGRAAFVGRLGDDDMGRDARRFLEADGVDTSGVVTVAGARSILAVILVDAATGGRTVVVQQDLRTAMTEADVPYAAVARARCVHLDTHEVAAGLAAATHARAVGTRVSLDAEKLRPGVERLVPLVDWLVCAEGFPRLFTGIADDRAALEALAALGPPVVVQTLGARGARAYVRHGTAGEHVESPGFAVPVVDTTGAGDVFHGAFALAMLDGVPAPDRVRAAMRRANAAAALKCGHLGGRAGIPTRAALEHFLAGHPG